MVRNTPRFGYFVLFALFATLVIVPAFSDVGANVTVANLPPYTPTCTGGATIYVHGTTHPPSYAFTRGGDDNADTVVTIVNASATTNCRGGSFLTNANETSFQTRGTSTNLNAITTSPTMGSVSYAYTSCTDTGSNCTKNYYYCLYTQDSSSQSNSLNGTPCNFTANLYNSRPGNPSTFQWSEANPAKSTNPTATFTAGTDVDSGDSLTQYQCISTTSGHTCNVIAATSASPVTITGAGLYGPGTNSNNTTHSQTKYWFRLYTRDNQGAVNSYSNYSVAAYDGTFNITNTRPTSTTSTNNYTSAPGVPVGGKVRFTIQYADVDTEDTGSGTVRICPSNSITGQACTSTELCSTTGAPATPLTCDYTTTSSDGSSRAVYAYAWDSRGLPYSTGVSTTFYVDQSVTMSNIQFGKAGTFGTFENGNSINCSANISAADGVVKGVRFTIYGPGYTAANYNYLSANVSANCTSDSWTAGKTCWAAFALASSGTDGNSHSCAHNKGTWNCVVNATNSADQNKTATPDPETMINTAVDISGGLSPWTGDTTITLVTTSGLWTQTTKGMNATYSDTNGYNDVNATTCASNVCKVYCRNPGTVDNSTAVNIFWNYSLHNFTTGDGDNFNGQSGCQYGGDGTRTAGMIPTFEAASTNGSWSCYMRLQDDGTGYDWTSSGTTFTVGENPAWAFDDSGDDGTPMNNLFFVLSGSPGERKTALIPDSSGEYVVYSRTSNSYANVRYSGPNFTRGTDGTHTIGIGNFTFGASTAATIDCSSGSYNSSCRAPHESSLRLVWGANNTLLDPIANYPAGVKRYGDGALLIPVGTLTGSYNSTFSYDYCLSSSGTCIDQG
ncbi:MAG: hypothetical protein V1820_06705 [archaeon]